MNAYISVVDAAFINLYMFSRDEIDLLRLEIESMLARSEGWRNIFFINIYIFLRIRMDSLSTSKAICENSPEPSPPCSS